MDEHGGIPGGDYAPSPQWAVDWEAQYFKARAHQGEVRKRAREERWVPPKFRGTALSDLRVPDHSPELERIRTDCIDWLDTLGAEDSLVRHKAGLWFRGVVGCGKTTIAYAILTSVIRKGYEVTAYTAGGLYAKIIATYGEPGSLEMDILDPIFHSKVFLLDDLGATRGKPNELEIIYRLVNQIADEGRVIVIVTTNYEGQKIQEDWGDMGVRIMDRFRDLCKLEAGFPDRSYRGGETDGD